MERVLVDLDHPPVNLACVRVILEMLDPNGRQPQSSSRCVGDEQIRVISEARLDGVLQEAVSEVNRWAEELRMRAYRLAYCLAPMQHHLEVQTTDNGQAVQRLSDALFPCSRAT